MSSEASSPKSDSEGAGQGCRSSGGPPGLTGGPFLVKVDRYGSVSALSRVETPLGWLVIAGSNEAGSFEPSLSLLPFVEREES